MTLLITVMCDHEGCFNELDLSANVGLSENEQIDNKGWMTDPEYQDFHYCEKHKHILDWKE